MKKIIASIALLAGSATAHEGHMGDHAGHLHGAEGLLMITALVVIVGTYFILKK